MSVDIAKQVQYKQNKIQSIFGGLEFEQAYNMYKDSLKEDMNLVSAIVSELHLGSSPDIYAAVWYGVLKNRGESPVLKIGVGFTPEYKERSAYQKDMAAIKAGTKLLPNFCWVECNGEKYYNFNGHIDDVDIVDTLGTM